VIARPAAEVIPDLAGDPGRILALVGGGGKTTLLHALGRHHGARAVLTTTTQMGADQHGDAQVVVGSDRRELATALEGHRPVLVWGRIDGDKAVGVSPDLPATWLDLVDYVVVEADGARGLPAKAPSRHEPALPDGPTDVLAVIGADAMNRVIADQCHRPLRVAAVVGCSPYERLDPVRAAILLSHPDGARRGVDNGFGVVVTKVSSTNRPLVDHLVETMAEQSPGIPMYLIADQHSG